MARICRFTTCPISYSDYRWTPCCTQQGLVLRCKAIWANYSKPSRPLIFSAGHQLQRCIKLNPGDAQYACLPNKQVVLWMICWFCLFEHVCAEGEARFMVVNASNMDKDWDWISSLNTFDTRIDQHLRWNRLIAVQAQSHKCITKTYRCCLSWMYPTLPKAPLPSWQHWLFLPAGWYTGSNGLNCIVKDHTPAALWDAVTRAGAELDICLAVWVPEIPWDLRWATALYGNDIDDTTSPLEAGLGWITKLKRMPISLQPLHRTAKKDGLMKIWFYHEERRVPRHDTSDAAGLNIGVVTSGTQSPSLINPLAWNMAGVNYAKPGTKFYIKMIGLLETEVTSLPFLTV